MSEGEGGGLTAPGPLSLAAPGRVVTPEESAAVVARYEPFFDRIIEGWPVRKALADVGEPYTTFMRLKREVPALQVAYDAARRDASELDEEAAVEVLREAKGAPMEEVTRANHESRALIWRAGARNAMRYRNQAKDGEGNTVSVQVMIINGQEIRF